MISDETIEAVRMQTDIVALIAGSGVRLKPQPHGSHFAGRCPFCRHRLHAFEVYPSQRRPNCPCGRPHHGTFHCFGRCKERGGDAIDFVSKHERVTWLEAVDRLAALVGIEVKWQRMVTVGELVPWLRRIRRRRRFLRLPAIEGRQEATNTFPKFDRHTGSRP